MHVVHVNKEKEGMGDVVVIGVRCCLFPFFGAGFFPATGLTLVDHPESSQWRENYATVAQFMKTNLFTVRPDDLVNLAASVMNWEHIRHIPVEDDEGRLVGLITHRDLLRLFEKSLENKTSEPISVRSIMKTDPETVSPTTPTLE